MAGDLRLLFATGVPGADRALRGVVVLVETLLPGRAVAYYLHGSYRDGTALPTSDLDVVVVLRPGVPDRERAGLVRALAVLGEAAAVPVDVLVAGEDELRRSGAVWLRDRAALLCGTDVAATFTALALPEYARLAMHGALTNLSRLYPPNAPLRYPLPPPDPADPWLGYVRSSVRLGDGSDRPGTALLAGSLSWVGSALVLRRGGPYHHAKGAAVARLYREYVGDAWADFLDDLYRRCRGDWHHLIPDSAADRAVLRGLCERAHGFFAYFLAEYRVFLLAELAEGMPARQLACRRLGDVFSDDAVRAVLVRLAALDGPLGAEARTALANIATPPDAPAGGR